MTNKIIEKVKIAMQKIALSKRNIVIGDGQAEEMANAAIEALDIIILPHDAEPEVEDLLSSGYKVVENGEYDGDHNIAEMYYCVERNQVHKYELGKIVLRNEKLIKQEEK